MCKLEQTIGLKGDLLWDKYVALTLLRCAGKTCERHAAGDAEQAVGKR